MNATALLTLMTLHAPLHHDDNRAAARPTQTCDAGVVASFDRLDDALRQLDEKILVMRGDRRRERDGGKKSRDEAHEKLVAVVAEAQRARIASCRASRTPDPVIIVEPAPPRPPVIVVLDDGGQQSLVNAVRHEAFDDARLSVLALGVRGVCVTSAQAKELVGELTFSKARIDAVRELAPRILDGHASYLLLESLTFESDKRTARDILASAKPARECSVPSVVPRL